MTLIDPTGGLGYSFGQKLPSTHMTTIATQQPNAIDGVNGGTYTPGAPVILNGASALQLGGKLKYTSRTVTRTQPLIPQVISTANWNWAASGGLLYWTNGTLATGCQIELTSLAHNSSMTALRVIYKGFGSGGARMALPGNKPSFALFKIDTSSVYTVVGASTSDTAATVAAYEASHSVSINIGGSFTVDSTQYRYILAVAAESGANSYTGAILQGITADFAVTEQPEV
jgi:hypothetical protein